jgi:3-hydroxybutyrate dehydrogenase
MNLAHKVAVITGGTRGIGFGIASAFVEQGAAVMLVGRSQEKGEKALAELGEPTRSAFFAGDATNRTDVEHAIESAVSRFGRLDILVNNVGGADEFAPVAVMSDEIWERGLLFNLTSAFYASRKALEYMIPQKSGRIINMSSVEGKHGKPFIVQYVTAKHALNGLTKGLSKEVAQEGITVNALCPGLVITDLIRESAAAAASSSGITAEAFIDQYAAEAAIGRPITVEEVAALALLIASDAGSGITGALLSVDGGTAAY